jgi:hypothetical protein
MSDNHLPSLKTPNAMDTTFASDIDQYSPKKPREKKALREESKAESFNAKSYNKFNISSSGYSDNNKHESSNINGKNNNKYEGSNNNNNKDTNNNNDNGKDKDVEK